MSISKKYISFIILLLPLLVLAPSFVALANGEVHTEAEGVVIFHAVWWWLLIVSVILMALLSWGVYKFLKVK